MTKEEAFQHYEEALAKIDKQAQELDKARQSARYVFRENLKVLCAQAHEELKAIRVLEQKTRRSKQNAG